VRFNRVNRIILFGGAPLLAGAARDLQAAGYEVFAFTSPRHAAEPVTAAAERLDTVLAALGVPFWVTEDINTEPNLAGLITAGTLGIGMGEAWSFGRPLIEAFGGRLVDFMGIPLPRYRGGAHYTWMILTGERRMACNIQLIDEHMVQGEHDSGAIVFRREYQLESQVRIPRDYFAAAVPAEVAFIRDFLAQINAGRDFPLEVPNEHASLFFPRLSTAAHGWIDWSWSGEAIERFICAFDEPYPGARTLLGQQVTCLRAAALDEGEPFHPFQSGLIVRVHEEEGIVVATTSGLLTVRQARLPSGEFLRTVHPGMRFMTPRALLEDALRDQVRYDSGGIRPVTSG